MKYGRNNILEKVKNKDKDFFYDIYNDEAWNSAQSEVSVAYEQSYGDGNEYFICMEFKLLNLFVLLEGTYSSWDAPHWHEVSLAMPYEFKETRYKAATLDYIREQKLNDILGKEE